MDQQPPATKPRKLEPEDYYFEGPLMVFTAAYHLKRGSCCGSGCRHCPELAGWLTFLLSPVPESEGPGAPNILAPMSRRGLERAE